MADSSISNDQQSSTSINTHQQHPSAPINTHQHPHNHQPCQTLAWLIGSVFISTSPTYQHAHQHTYQHTPISHQHPSTPINANPQLGHMAVAVKVVRGSGWFVYQQLSTIINNHYYQHPLLSTIINNHQQPPTPINNHQHPSTPINSTHQHPSTIRT